MAYGIKYVCNYKSVSNQDRKIELALEGYVGAIIPIKALGGQACVIQHVNDNLDKFDPIIESKADLNFIQEGQINVEELQTSNDFDFRAQYFESGLLKWEGYIIPDGIQRTYQAAPNTFNITATDGLNWLKGKEFQYGLGGNRNYLLYLREIFHRNYGFPHSGGGSGGLQSEMPLRWINTITNEELAGDADETDIISTSSLQIDYKGIIDQDANKEKTSSGKKKSFYWILENIAKSLSARIYQSDGRWVLERISDVTTGSYSYRESDKDGNITSGVEDVNKSVTGDNTGDYRFIKEDAIITVSPGVKTVRVTYSPQIFETILPNGDFEQVAGLPGSEIVSYWEKLDTRDLIDPANMLGWWSQVFAIPETITPIAPGIYNTSKYAVSLPLEPDPNGTTWGLVYDDKAIQGIAIPIDTSIWDRFTLQLKYAVTELNAGWIDPAINIKMWYIESENNVHSAYDIDELMVYGYWNPNISDDTSIPINRVDGQQDVGDVVQVVFNNNGDISMPFDVERGAVKGLLNGITFMFAISSTIHRCAIDDIRLSPTEKKSEVWEAVQTASSFTEEIEIEHEIGSAYTGFYWSNYTLSWGNTFRDFEFTDTLPDATEVKGTLSELAAQAILRNNALPSKIFQGTIKGIFRFGEIYTFEGLPGKYMALSSDYNTEQEETTLRAIEVRNGAVALTVGHYGKT